MSSVREDDRQPLNLDAIDAGLDLVEEKRGPDARDLLEREGLKKLGLENQLTEARIQNVKADRRLRKTYASRILRFLEWYSVGVALLVVAHGAKYNGFRLEPEIVVALVGSTAIAAIGLVGFIARGLFKPPEAPKE